MSNDFSINTCILPLSNVLQLMQYNNEYDNGWHVNSPLTWKDVIENGLRECDGMEDCTQDKVLRSPKNSQMSIEGTCIDFGLTRTEMSEFPQMLFILNTIINVLSRSWTRLDSFHE